jgi:hypothetical protein
LLFSAISLPYVVSKPILLKVVGYLLWCWAKGKAY